MKYDVTVQVAVMMLATVEAENQTDAINKARLSGKWDDCERACIKNAIWTSAEAAEATGTIEARPRSTERHYH
jgi:hypothetical protein